MTKVISLFLFLRRSVFLFFLLGFPLKALSQEQFQQSILDFDCQRLGGSFIDSLKCHKSELDSQADKSEKYCVVKSKSGLPLVFDGCSSPNGLATKYKEFFYEACKRHDLCYHNNLERTIRGKQACDREFFNGMKSLCKIRMGEKSLWKECGSSAVVFYNAVDKFGDSSFRCIEDPLDPEEYEYIYDKSEI
jgi:hypothetical protein